MSQVAILIILAAGQVNDSGWQSNTREVPVTATRDSDRRTASSTIDKASFNDLESDPSANDPTDDFDEQFGDDFGDDFQRGFDLTDETLGGSDSADRLLDRDSPTDSLLSTERGAGSFWDKHDLLLNAPMPARDLDPKTEPQRFRRVDSWNIPIPELPLNAATPANGDFELGRIDSERSTNRHNRRTNEGSDREFRNASDRDRYLPEKYRNPPRDLRQRNEDAFELNRDASREEGIRPVRHTPAEYDAQSWKAMPTSKAMNLMFGGKTATTNNDEQNGANSIRQGSLFASAKNMFWPFVFASLGLVASLAFNLYLGFIAWDIHGQYQDVVADLSDMESREDEMPPSLLENRASQALSSRVDQSGSRRRSISI